MNKRKWLTALILVSTLLSSILACRSPFAAQPTAVPTPTATPLSPTPPLLVDYTPARGEETPLERPLTLTFDQPMDRTSVEAAFSINPPIEGRFSWSDSTTLVFTPSSGWQRATRYRVAMDTSAKSAAGLALRQELDLVFRTVGYLEVTQVIPEPGTAEVEPDATVTIMFNRPVVPLQLVSAPVSDLPSPVEFDPPVDGSGEWLNTSIFVFHPTAGFVPGRAYQATVPAGLSDTTGGVLEQDFTWDFIIQAPYVVSTIPEYDASLVPLNQPITVTFSQPMERRSTEAAFSLITVDGQQVNGRFAWSDDDTALTFTPLADGPALLLDTTYVARIAASARAAVGDTTLQSELRWTFETVPYPRVVSTDPTDGDNDAPPDTSFEIEFASPMNVATLLPNIAIIPEPTHVYTWWSSYENRFTVSWDTQPSTSYEVRLGGAMADPYGNTIGQEQVVRFTTRALDPMAYLAVPGNVGTYNGYLPTQVHVLHRNVSQVDLSLYRLDLATFRQLNGPNRWDAWETFDPDQSAALLRRWSLPASAPLNEFQYLLVDLAEGGGSLAPGLYFLQVTSPETSQSEWLRPAQHILVVSRLHLTFKLSQRQALLWATDLQSGLPLPGLAVTISSETDSPTTIARGRTDDDGLLYAEFDPLTDMWTPYLAVSAEPGSDSFAIAVSEWYDGISPWDFDLSSQFGAEPYRLYLHTDRPIYRPGQPVYFRGILRSETDARYTIPQQVSELPLVVYDDQGQQVYSDTLPLSDLGTFDGQFTLGPEAGLGYYYIETRIDQWTSGAGFQVAEYRRPEFQVIVTTDRDEVLAGETVNVAVEATYFFGAPVANAHVDWTLLTQDHAFNPDVPGWWDWSDTSRWDQWRPQEIPGWGRVVADGQGLTDAQGRFVFGVPADLGEALLSQQLTIEATVTDVSDQSVSNRTTVIAHKGLFYVGLRPARYVGQAGQAQTIDVRTVDWASNPVSSVPLSVTFSQREWLNVQEEDEYGNLYWTWTPSDTVVFSQTVTSDAEGQASAAFVPPEGGTYVVHAAGRDAQGNAVLSATWLWVSGREYVSWRQENNDRIQLIADRRSYRPGDTARILVPSPFQGEVTALFTVERGQVIEHWVQTLSGNAETIDLPISADFAPNVYVSVVLVKGVDETNPLPAYRVGYVSFDVSTAQQELTVTITPDRDAAAGEHYGPRDTVTARLQVNDADGRPVEAEVAVAVVDKAVLSLAQPNVPAIVPAFYGQRGLGVRTADSLSLSVDRINAQVSPDAKGGGGGGPELALGAEFIRRDFPDTAYWAANVRTDAQGQAMIEFQLPDQLTTWNIDARAVTADTLVGQTNVEILSTRDLLLRPLTPRFFVVGDRVELAATVHNNTAGPLTVDVWLDAAGVTLLGDARHTVDLPAGGQERLEWSVQVDDAEAADLTFHVDGGGYADAVKPPAGLPPDQLLPIYHYSAPETVGTAGQLDDEGSVLEAVVLSPSVDASQGQLIVRVEPSLAAGMTGGLDYLEHYPYECTEQVVSRFLPNVLTFRALLELGLEDAELEANLRQQVAVGLQRLVSRQHVDGGWGWWVDDESDTLVSAYVVFGLVKAQQAGFGIDPLVLEQGIGFLRERLRPTANLHDDAADRQAYVLYVLAEAAAAGASEFESAAELTSLYNVREQLSLYARAYLALAFDLTAGDDPRIDTLLSDLNSAAIVSATGAHWQESTPPGWNWNTDTRTSAIVLDALARLDPQNAFAANAVRWLMHARTADHWETTQETAWALIALTDWMVATGELEGNYQWEVRLNGASLGADQVTPRTVREAAEFRVAVAELLLDQTNRLELGRTAGPGQLYYTAHLQAYLPVEKVQALNRGIVVGRVYESADCVENCPPLTTARVGERVRVRLTIIAPHDLNYVVIEDPFPAGAEPLDTSLQTTSVVGERPEVQRTDVEEPWWVRGWGWWWFSNTDLRDEQLVLFASSLPAGTYEYTYVLQMGLAGEYRVLPINAYEMYFPEVMGRSDGMLFSIER